MLGETPVAMDKDFQVEFEEECEIRVGDLFLRDEDGVVYVDNERGFGEDEYPLLQKIPTYPMGYNFVGA